MGGNGGGEGATEERGRERCRRDQEDAAGAAIEPVQDVNGTARVLVTTRLAQPRDDGIALARQAGVDGQTARLVEREEVAVALENGQPADPIGRVDWHAGLDHVRALSRA